MVRINSPDSLPLADLNKFGQGKIVKRLGRKRFGVKKFCCLFFVLVLLFFLVATAAVVAKTGLVNIPFFSDVFYRLPRPQRQITIANQADFLQKNLNLTLNPSQSTAKLELTEEQLTLLVRQLLSNKNDPYFASNAQAVIANGQIEFFGLLLRPVSANITIKFKPYLADNKLNFELTSLKIGDLTMPVPLADWLAVKFFSNPLSQLSQKLAEFKVQQLEVLEGKLILTIPAGNINKFSPDQFNLN